MSVKTYKVNPTPDPIREVQAGSGLSFRRFFTHAGVNPLDEMKYEKRTSVIANPDGSTVFKMENVEIKVR